MDSNCRPRSVVIAIGVLSIGLLSNRLRRRNKKHVPFIDAVRVVKLLLLFSPLQLNTPIRLSYYLQLSGAVPDETAVLDLDLALGAFSEGGLFLPRRVFLDGGC